MRVKKQGPIGEVGSDVPRPCQGAVIAGRREPYHLTYIRRYGQIKPENACKTSK